MKLLRSSVAAQPLLPTLGRHLLQLPEMLPVLYQDRLAATDPAHFSVFTRSEHPCKGESGPGRLDMYKISFLTAGTGNFTYGTQHYALQPYTLSFLNPHEWWSWQATSSEQDGFFCLFNEPFLAHPLYLQSLRQHPFFQLGTATPVLRLTAEQAATTQELFAKLMHEFNTPGPLRPDLLRLTLQLLLLEALRFAPEVTNRPAHNAATQLTYQFLTLLEQQFPLVELHDRLTIRYPAQFAEALSVQTNHLNACVKTTTGKSLRTHIQGRILSEAQVLLKYSNWQVSEIAYVLGFEEVAAFTHFFRKATGVSPLAYRD